MDFENNNGLKNYHVIVTDGAYDDLDIFVAYLLLVKKNDQAAGNLLDDFNNTISQLETVAGSLKLDDDPDLAALGYHRIHLKKHRYFLLYRINGDNAVTDNMFHDLQDYKNHMWDI